MFQVHLIRIATVAALGVLLVLWGDARAVQEHKAGAAETLEVQVLELQVTSGQGGSATRPSTAWRYFRCYVPPPPG